MIITAVGKLATNDLRETNKERKMFTSITPSFVNEPILKTRFDCFKAAFEQFAKVNCPLFSDAGLHKFRDTSLHLKSDSTSAFTDQMIKGQVYQLEDGKTKLSH